MRWSLSGFSITAAFALFIAVGMAKSSAQSVDDARPIRSEGPRSGDARGRFERAIAAAHREIEERGAPALTASIVGWASWIFAALRVEAARAERDDYERSGYNSRRGALEDDLADKRRVFGQFKTQAEEMFALFKSGKTIPDEQRIILRLRLDRSLVELQTAETELLVFERYHGPLRRRQLAEEVARATGELSAAQARNQRRRDRLRRKLGVLGQSLSGGPAWIGRLLSDLKVHATEIAPPDGPAKGRADDQAGQIPRQAGAVQARRSAVIADVSQIVLASARWLAATSNLARSLLVLQRKQFDFLVPGHPGLGMRPTGGLIPANVILHQQQGQPQRQ